MLTPKSLLTWMMESFFRPWSSAYFAAAVPCSASEVMVRKKTPLVLPSRPSCGQRRRGGGGRHLHHAGRRRHRGQDRDRHRRDDAADDDRHLLHLDELRRRIDRDVALALRVARVGDELAAATPPASLMSRNAISTDLAPACPYSPAGPVSSMTRPTLISQSAAWATLAIASKRRCGRDQYACLLITSPLRSLRTSSITSPLRSRFPADGAIRRRTAPPDWRLKARSTACGSTGRHDTVARCIPARRRPSPAQIVRWSSTVDT